MKIGRRIFLAGSAVSIMAPGIRAAEPENAVFWRAVFPNHDLALFGYVRIRADLVPDIYSQGKTLVSQSSALLLDMSPDVKMPTVNIERNQTEPVLNKLSPSTQPEFREVMKTLVPEGEIARLAGFTASIFLCGEGQHPFTPQEPSIGFALVKYAQEAGRPMTTLASDQEVVSLSKPITTEKFNAVGPSTIEYLLQLRRRIGPIGAHFDELYRTRQSAEIARLAQEMTNNGVLSPTNFLDPQPLRKLLIDRLANQASGTNAFVTMPRGLLSGPMSILDELRSRGATVSAMA
ncbi:hypothetical protein [Allorhizobium taibaishanense]|uniref:TraB/GumN family protein n=1 Tax=Allorhizobium taibaishanense TaxID=887144 RepID=A0A1Q9AAW3_9HYPH|nr:hypothetical protein [Allorhizobium taibaishanense]MBB4010429.1 hypothetical protein [Allorhizobium taibaishanense]OLP51993.1 hypothetical protein BJF91_09585 [Allorhizobium taibaishanense]